MHEIILNLIYKSGFESQTGISFRSFDGVEVFKSLPFFGKIVFAVGFLSFL